MDYKNLLCTMGILFPRTIILKNTSLWNEHSCQHIITLYCIIPSHNAYSTYFSSLGNRIDIDSHNEGFHNYKNNIWNPMVDELFLYEL